MSNIWQTNITLWMLWKILLWAVTILWSLVTIITKYNTLEHRVTVIEIDNRKLENKVDTFHDMQTKIEKIMTDIDWIKKNINK